ncbi:hypothetical protein N7490_005189 [Penicillium lividum]|nr:hypothetical protein N7490_005189 [Penicillium lividum]
MVSYSSRNSTPIRSEISSCDSRPESHHSSSPSPSNANSESITSHRQNSPEEESADSPDDPADSPDDSADSPDDPADSPDDPADSPDDRQGIHASALLKDMIKATPYFWKLRKTEPVRLISKKRTHQRDRRLDDILRLEGQRFTKVEDKVEDKLFRGIAQRSLALQFSKYQKDKGQVLRIDEISDTLSDPSPEKKSVLHKRRGGTLKPWVANNLTFAKDDEDVVIRAIQAGIKQLVVEKLLQKSLEQAGRHIKATGISALTALTVHKFRILSLEEIPTFLQYILSPLSEITISDDQSARTDDNGLGTSTGTVNLIHITEIIGTISSWFETFQKTYDLFTCPIPQPEASEQPLLKRAYLFPNAERIATRHSTGTERDQLIENIQGESVSIESVFVQQSETLDPTESHSCCQEVIGRQDRGEFELAEGSATSEQAAYQLDGNLEHQALVGSQNEEFGLEHQGNDSQSILPPNHHNSSDEGTHQSVNRDPLLTSATGLNRAVEENSLERSESDSEGRNLQEVIVHLLASRLGIFDRTSQDSASLDSQLPSDPSFVSQQESLNEALRSDLSLGSTGASHSSSLDPQQKVLGYGFPFDPREVLHPASTADFLDPQLQSFSQSSLGGFPFDPREVLHPASTADLLDPEQQSFSQSFLGGFPFDPREVLHPASTADFLDPQQQSFSQSSLGGFPFDPREVLHPASTADLLDPEQQSFSQSFLGGFPFDPRVIMQSSPTTGRRSMPNRTNLQNADFDLLDSVHQVPAVETCPNGVRLEERQSIFTSISPLPECQAF